MKINATVKCVCVVRSEDIHYSSVVNDGNAAEETAFSD